MRYINKDSTFSLIMFITALGVGLIFGFLAPSGTPRVVMSSIFTPVLLLVALYSIHYLPANYIGFALLCVGIIFLVSDAYNKNYSIHSLGAVIAIIISYVVLIKSNMSGLNIQMVLMFSGSLVILLSIVAKFGTVLRSKK